MIKINLLPYREKEKKENVARQIFIIAGCLVIYLLALAAVQIWMSTSISDLENKVKEGDLKLTELDKKIGDLEKYKKDKKELELKLGVISILEENRITPVKILDELASLVPANDIWLTRISQKGDKLDIDGVGRNNIVVADFMKVIENFSPVQSVDLISSKKTEVAGITMQQFSFSCILKKGF
jgi:type IV pilus assembly protein PilN